MAYDLIYKTTTPVNLARPSGPEDQRSFLVKMLGLCVAGAALALPEIQRRREIAKYKREFATDAPIIISKPKQRPTYAERRLKTTMEIPVVPMKDFSFPH